jgi:hypothetical protein
MQRAARWVSRWYEEEPRDLSSGVSGKSSAIERNERCSGQRSGQDISERKKREMKRAARRVRRRQEKERSDAARGTAGVASAGERNERCSDRYGRQGVGKRKKAAIQPAARRARCRQDEESSDSASGTAGKVSARARNERFSERYGGRSIGGRNKRVTANGSAGSVSSRERSVQLSERRRGQEVHR